MIRAMNAGFAKLDRPSAVLVIAAGVFVMLCGMASPAASRPLNHTEARSAGWSVLELSPRVAEELAEALQK